VAVRAGVLLGRDDFSPPSGDFSSSDVRRRAAEPPAPRPASRLAHGRPNGHGA